VVRVSARIRRTRVRVSVSAAKYGQSAIHFDDLQMQTVVGERVIKGHAGH